ncbi:2-amino-4-hydroxy-6-hydroxymethyldihydropteridine diphosphokinase [Bacillaceae bacterium S4-13-58]
MKNMAYIALGSNLGERDIYLKKAIDRLKSHSFVNILKCSSIYETDPVGFEDQDQFLNMVINIETDLSPEALLEECLRIEKELGRERLFRWGPRVIDLDILLYNQENMESEKLTIPHPRMKERAFVILPLFEIDSELIFPDQHDTISSVVQKLPEIEKKGVRLWKRINGEGGSVPIES